MNTSLPKPWASGPKEILSYGLSLQATETDAAHRIAMILIDSAVELMIKTYLGLPKRVTGLTITRSQYEEFGDSFPKLLDALERYAPERLGTVDLAEIEWYHRLRNQLYHEGNGITVERDKLIVYAGIAKLLYRNLFDAGIDVPDPTASDPASQSLSDRARVEHSLLVITQKLGVTREPSVEPSTPRALAMALDSTGAIPSDILPDLQVLSDLRNKVLSPLGAREEVSRTDVRRIKQIAATLEKRASRK